MSEAPYPYPESTGGGFLELFSYVSLVTDGIFFAMILGIIWVVAFINTKAYSSSRAFTFASFLCMVLSIGFAILDLLSVRYMYLTIILVGIGAFWMKLEA